jgi:hypothetical protein
MAEDCVSLIPGVAKLIADKGYDTDAFRSYLKEQGIKPVIPANPIARPASAMTSWLTKAATSSSAASVASKTSAASPPVMTSSPETSSRRFA